MSYSDFTLKSIQAEFGTIARTERLFADAVPATPPEWLVDLLARTMQIPLISEKARSELIVMPVLLACRTLTNDKIAIFSGSRMDVDPDRGLYGECDFILSRTPSAPELRAPLIAIVEAKKNDVEAGMGQCIAQMIGARQFNDEAGMPICPIYGCITTGEVWQFLKLEGATASIDTRRYYLDSLPEILGVFLHIINS